MNVGSVLSKAFKNIFSKHGFQISLLYFLFFGLAGITLPALLQEALPADINPSLIVFIGMAGILYIILSIIVIIGVLRSLYHRELKAEYFTDSIGFTGSNLAADGILTAIVAPLGLILFVIPGLIAIVALSLSPLYIALEHNNVIDAIKNSWKTTKNHWLQIFGVLFVVWAVYFVIAFLTAIPEAIASIIGGPLRYVVLTVTTYISVYTSLLQTSAIVELYRALT